MSAYATTIADAWEAIPDDMTGDHDSLADAITALVAQRDQARVGETAWAREAQSRLDDLNRAAGTDVTDRENDAATSALWALRQYMARLNDAGTLTVPRVLGWLDHAIDGADQ